MSCGAKPMMFLFLSACLSVPFSLATFYDSKILVGGVLTSDIGSGTSDRLLRRFQNLVEMGVVNSDHVDSI